MTALPRFRRFAASALPMILVIVPAEARIGRAIEDPVVVQLHAPRTRTLAGEGITLDLTVKVRANLEMESVELNRDRTRIIITNLDKRISKRELSGRDYIRLHRVNPLENIGQSFQAKSGDAWSVKLNLLQYASPLPAGRYRIQVSYRYGQSDRAAVLSNAVDVEVAPAPLLGVGCRWFGTESVLENQLACVWRARNGIAETWFFQASDRHDPLAIQFSTRLDGLGGRPDTVPMLAHLNDAGAKHFERYVVWTDSATVCWQRIQPEGRIGASSCTVHGLKNDARLVDPPLQRRDGGLNAVVVSANAAALIDVAKDGRSSRRTIPWTGGDATRAVVIWSNDESAVNGYLYSTGARLRRTDLQTGQQEDLGDVAGGAALLLAKQWKGQSELFTASTGATTTIRSWIANPSSYSVPPLNRILTAAPLIGSNGIALVAESPRGWIISAGRQSARTFPAEGDLRAPLLISGPDTLFLLEHFADRGFVAKRVTATPK